MGYIICDDSSRVSIDIPEGFVERVSGCRAISPWAKKLSTMPPHDLGHDITKYLRTFFCAPNSGVQTYILPVCCIQSWNTH